MVASLRRSVSEEWLEMESGGTKKRKKRKGEGGGGEARKVIFSLPTPLPPTSFCFVRTDSLTVEHLLDLVVSDKDCSLLCFVLPVAILFTRRVQ